MNNLIDHFTPSELLHIVSISNQHGFLKTENKRFLIALRMTSPWADGEWQVDEEKKSRFIPILGQFLQELEPWQRCSKDECEHCDRFQALHKDFHGSQESPEFRLFMDWFLSGSKTYGAGSKTASAASSPAGGSSQGTGRPANPVRPAAAVPAAVPSLQNPLTPAVPAPVVPVPSQAAEAAVPQTAETPVLPVPKAAVAAVQPEPPKPVVAARHDELPGHPQVKDLPRSWDAAQPLFTLNQSHPAVRALENLARQDLHLMDDYQLRDFTSRLQKMTREFLASMACLQDAEEDGEAARPEKGGLRRIV